jgi:cold shock CspA family protein
MTNIPQKRQRQRNLSDSSYIQVNIEHEDQSKMAAAQATDPNTTQHTSNIISNQISDMKNLLNIINNLQNECQTTINSNKKTVKMEKIQHLNTKLLDAKQLLSKIIKPSSQTNPKNQMQINDNPADDSSVIDIDLEHTEPTIQKEKPIRTTGIVKFFNFNHGWGIIVTKDVDVERNLFVHRSSITKSKTADPRHRSLCEGEPVEFEVITKYVLNENNESIAKFEAKNVTGPGYQNVKGMMIKFIYQKPFINRGHNQQKLNIPPYQKPYIPSMNRDQNHQKPYTPTMNHRPQTTHPNYSRNFNTSNRQQNSNYYNSRHTYSYNAYDSRNYNKNYYQPQNSNKYYSQPKYFNASPQPLMQNNRNAGFYSSRPNTKNSFYPSKPQFFREEY